MSSQSSDSFSFHVPMEFSRFFTTQLSFMVFTSFQKTFFTVKKVLTYTSQESFFTVKSIS